jgi:hypothetical protein
MSGLGTTDVKRDSQVAGVCRDIDLEIDTLTKNLSRLENRIAEIVIPECPSTGEKNPCGTKYSTGLSLALDQKAETLRNINKRMVDLMGRIEL